MTVIVARAIYNGPQHHRMAAHRDLCSPHAGWRDRRHAHLLSVRIIAEPVDHASAPSQRLGTNPRYMVRIVGQMKSVGIIVNRMS